MAKINLFDEEVDEEGALIAMLKIALDTHKERGATGFVELTERNKNYQIVTGLINQYIDLHYNATCRCFPSDLESRRDDVTRYVLSLLNGVAGNSESE